MHEVISVANTRVYIEGNGQTTIIFLHGWPDTHELWRRQIDFFKQHYTCVSFTLPAFEEGDRRDYSTSDVVQRIGEVVDAVSPDRKVILFVHDWGCVFGYEYAMRHSGRVEKMIGLDVGDADSQALRESLSLPAKLMVFTYQIILAVSFVLPAALGDGLARFMAKALQARSILKNVHAGMSMPYAMRWFGVNGGLSNLLPVEPPFPFYYGYATGKPMMFHSPQWLERLSANPENNIQPFDCGHWIMVDEADSLNEMVHAWLQRQQ